MINTSTFRPTKGRVLLKLKKTEVLKSGIIIPGAEGKMQNQGTVVASHPDSEFKPGENLMIEQINEDMIFDEGSDTYVIANEEHVIARIEEVPV
jgi:co-chaperonin GroES (HSP10)